MKTYGKIKDGVLVEKILEPRQGFIEIPESAICGMIYDGQKFTAPAPRGVPYARARLKKYPQAGDQLDAEYKARQKRIMLVGKAREELKRGTDAAKVLALVLEALEPTDEQNHIDGKILAAKKAHPKE